MTPRFLNTLSREKELLPCQPGQPVRIYTCGPTVYDYAHIGNFRAYVFEDLLQRTLEAAGYPVLRAMNFTDVDDKTIRNSRQRQMRLADFTALYKKAFLEDLATLRILQPANMPAATDYIERMIEMIQTLEAKGIAYQADDKSVYFRLSAYPNYGRLAHIDLAELRPSGRINNDEYEKEAIGDFALWKARDEQDGDNFWPSPWGEGRPGWHIECSAMATAILGDTLDIHCGGVDNIFPHHEAEIAQSECCTGLQFVKLWMHCEHLRVENQKMSKSLGNFYTLRDLTERGYTGRQLRYVLMNVHYRAPLNFTFADLDASKTVLLRLDEWTARLREKIAALGAPTAPVTPAPWGNDFLEALGDDLNISKALAHLFDAIRDSNRSLDTGTATADSLAAEWAAWQLANGILQLQPSPEESSVSLPPDIQALLDERAQARTDKQWKRSDELRDQLKALGWLVKDTPKGQDLRRA